MPDLAIAAEGLGKRYRVGRRERYRALRDVVSGAVSAPWQRLRRQGPTLSDRRADWFWALQDVSFEVKHGEVVGVIGRNGAGKTTLLKVLGRVTRPTAGRAEVRGRLGSLLEVGTGFHPELTGRENVYLSGAILGMSKRAIDIRFDEIVEFAGVGDFLTTPLKHFSSGMQTRLAFAVAAHLESEILLVDEVLAVGDLEFQRKCLGKMEEVSSEGRTVLLVTHQMNQIRRLSTKVLWLDKGRVRQLGSTTEVVAAYESAVTRRETGSDAAGMGKASFVSWEIEDPAGPEPNVLAATLNPVTVALTVDVKEPILNALHGIALVSNEGQIQWSQAIDRLALAPGAQEFRYTFPMLPLRPGLYSWVVSLYDSEGLIDEFTCVPDLVAATESYQHPLDRWCGVLNVPCDFTVDARHREAGVATDGF